MLHAVLMCVYVFWVCVCACACACVCACACACACTCTCACTCAGALLPRTARLRRIPRARPPPQCDAPQTAQQWLGDSCLTLERKREENTERERACKSDNCITTMLRCTRLALVCRLLRHFGGDTGRLRKDTGLLRRRIAFLQTSGSLLGRFLALAEFEGSFVDVYGDGF